MATIAPRSFALSGTARCTIRPAAEIDADALLEHQAHMIATDPNSVTEADEPRRTRAQQLESIAAHLNDPGQLLLVATHDGEPAALIGALAFRSGDRRRVRHHGHLGLSVHADWRGKGVGSALITTVLDWAAGHSNLEKVCLGTLATNEGAQRLYRRLGFVQESRAPKFFKLAPGTYVDDIWMAIYVKPGVAPAGFRTWGDGGLAPGLRPAQSVGRGEGGR